MPLTRVRTAIAGASLLSVTFRILAIQVMQEAKALCIDTDAGVTGEYSKLLDPTSCG